MKGALVALSICLALFMFGCGGDAAGPAPDPSTARLRVLALPPADTIEARPAQGLVLEVTDAAGVPVPASIEVEAEDSTEGIPDVRFADRFGQGYRGRLSLATDATGRATAYASYGLRVGPIRILVRLGGTTTGERVTLTVLPGAAVELRIPSDTALILGRSLTPIVLDREANVRNDPVTITTTAPLVAVGGSVSGMAYGQGVFTSVSGGLARTTRVTVVPDGVLALASNGGNALFRTDGSEYRLLGDNSSEWGAWAPDGIEFAFGGSQKLSVVDLNGNERLASAVNSGFSAEWAPQYSPDGQHIYFTVVDDQSYRIMRVKRNGQSLEFAPGMDTVYALEGTVSPAGMILYRGQSGFALRNLSTGATIELGFDGFSPRFSPDGTRIAYAHGITRGLWIMRSDGTEPMKITDDVAYAYSLDWSPDQKWLVAASVGISGANAHVGTEIIEVATGLRLPLPFGQIAGVGWKPR